MASLASELFRHGKIQTTLTRAKALRPFAEKIITWAKKSALEEEKGRKLHFRRLALAKVRDGIAVRKLFDESVSLFSSRVGGYTRISKLMPRIGDAAPQAFIQYVDASLKSGTKRKRRSSAAGKKSSEKVKNEVAGSSEPEVQESSVASEESGENLA
jgi:large subunit ribosomal protein L17